MNTQNFVEDHNCHNDTCRLLNPSLDKLLRYEDLRYRVCRAEEIFFDSIKSIAKFQENGFPMGLGGWCRIHNIFQLLNIEFIKELSTKIREMGHNTILEVGAGRGLLGKYLSDELGQEIILTDDYSWWDRNKINLIDYNIKKMDYKEAIKTYNPELIIVSWIPYKKRWTEHFRDNRSVKGYIIIGEGPGGCTGSYMDWKTSWIRQQLDDVENYGICRSDFFHPNHISLHTNVTYFKRP